MCFYIDTQNPLPKIARENIICYKDTLNENVGIFRFKSYNQRFTYWRWIKNKVVDVNVKYGEINEGYHSFIEKQGNGKFMIPKGSVYYINPNRGYYVSNQLIYLGPIYRKK